MAKDPGFKFYPGDYLRDTQNLSEKSQVAYDRIMCEHMRNISTDMNKIVITEKTINFFIKRLTDEEKDEVFHVLTPVNNDYQIEWVALSISKTRAYNESRSKNRKGKLKNHINNISKTYEKHMDNDNDNDKDIDNVLKGGVGEKINFERVFNSQWMETIYTNLEIQTSYDNLLSLWTRFQKEMEMRDDLYRDVPQYRAHFASWVKKQLEKPENTATGINIRKDLFKVKTA